MTEQKLAHKTAREVERAIIQNVANKRLAVLVVIRKEIEKAQKASGNG